MADDWYVPPSGPPARQRKPVSDATRRLQKLHDEIPAETWVVVYEGADAARIVNRMRASCAYHKIGLSFAHRAAEPTTVYAIKRATP